MHIRRTCKVCQTTRGFVKPARLKLDSAGHVCRMESDRWAQIITNWFPHETCRRRGRPRRRWQDELDAYLKNWLVMEQDRGIWRHKGVAFAQQWDTLLVAKIRKKIYINLVADTMSV